MKLETVGSSPILHPMNTPIVMTDSAFGEAATIIICDGCYTECSSCNHRFYCYTTGTIFGTKDGISSKLKELYSLFIKAQDGA